MAGWLAIVATVLLAVTGELHAARIKDIAGFRGVRSNQLVGYGLVVGLAGSGVFIVNPPHTLHGQLATLLPWLVRQLGQYAGASHVLEQRAA